jgi:hypothetical protein
VVPAVNERRLIAVSWCMPPALFPRSIQVARVLKGLQSFGWDSVVVTPRVDRAGNTDPLDETLERLYASYYDTELIDLARGDLPNATPIARWTRWMSGEDELSDEQLWVRRAAAAVERVARRDDVLVTFAQPWRDHLVGLELFDFGVRLPWVAHFSDPWVDNPYYDDLPPNELATARAREARVIASADAIVFTNAYAVDLVMAKYPDPWRRKVHVVPHAVDRDLLDRVDSPPHARQSPRAPLRLAHVGNLFAGRRTAQALFAAVAAISARRSLEHRLQLIFVGEGSGLQEARDTVRDLGLSAIVTFRERVSHLESLAAMRDADVLVLIDAPADTNVFLPSKIADYLVAHRPILALTPPVGPSADLVRELGYPLVRPDDVPGVIAALEALLDQHERGVDLSSGDVDATRRYELHDVAASFAAVLDLVALPSRSRLR